MEELLTRICYLILLFFIFSFLGWCMEVTLKFRQYGRFINRGFLIGPYLPIYGSGVVCITVLVQLFAGVESSIGTTFFISFFGCGILEYAASYFMEKRFHARWWDYSQKPMNLHGRIWIGNLVLFGIGGTVVIEGINPVLYSWFEKIPQTALYILSGAIVLVMLSDYVVSHFVMKFVKTSVENSEADNTESISKEIRLLMNNKSILYRRIADAYPDVIYRTDRIKARMHAVKAEMDRLQQEAKDSLDRVGQEARTGVELVQNGAISGIERVSQSTRSGLERVSQGTRSGIERFSHSTKSGIERVSQSTKSGIERVSQTTKSGLERLQQETSYSLELMKVTPSELQDDIILKQDQLIGLLENPEPDQEQISELQNEILQKKKLLADRKNLYRITRQGPTSAT